MATKRKSVPSGATYSNEADAVARLIDVMDLELRRHRSDTEMRRCLRRVTPDAGLMREVRTDLVNALAKLSGKTPAEVEEFLTKAE